MTAHETSPFAHAERTASAWLSSVTEGLDTDDPVFAYRALRSWLHVVRDRLPAETATHLGAQLPELLRGLYYEGWSPGRTPQTYGWAGFVRRFAEQAGISAHHAPAVAASITATLRGLFSEGTVDKVLACLPRQLRDELSGAGTATTALRNRIAAIEDDVALLTDAVRELARGLEPSPLDDAAPGRAAKAARTVHQLLLADPAPSRV